MKNRILKIILIVVLSTIFIFDIIILIKNNFKKDLIIYQIVEKIENVIKEPEKDNTQIVKEYLEEASKYYNNLTDDEKNKLPLNIIDNLNLKNHTSGTINLYSDGNIEMAIIINEICFIKEQHQTINEIIKKDNFEKCEIPKKEEVESIPKEEPQQPENKPTIEEIPLKEDNKVENDVIVVEPPKQEQYPTLGIKRFIYNDGSFIPDKFNSGINPSIALKKYNIGDNFPFLAVKSTVSTGKGEVLDAMVINMGNKTNEATKGNIVIENYDFTNYVFRIYNSSTRTEKVTIIFKNCKFSSIKVVAELNDNINLKFENSEMDHFDGSNATFNNCKFSIATSDGLNPYKNVTVTNSYFANDKPSYLDGIVHLDGVQIFGKANLPATNIHLINSRFELPYIRETINGALSGATVNAPLMLQLEYSNGDNISFKNLHINGGGYSIYTHGVNGFTYNNVILDNISVGMGKLYRIQYPDITLEGYTSTNVRDTNMLYIGSVWKDDNGIHISVTNDTLEKRKITIETNKGNFSFEIDAHPKLTKETAVNYSFSQMPYDIEKIINDKTISWIKCYDTTTNNNLETSNLIKTYNFSN